jgi:hypothetical protein
MAWRGITVLYSRKKRKRTDFWWIDPKDTDALRIAKARAEEEAKVSPPGLVPTMINPMAGFKLSYPTWVNSIDIDKTEAGNMSDLWRRLMHDEEHMHDYITSNKSLQLLRIEAFKVNGKIVSVKDLYGYSGRTWCVFISEKNRNSLLVVGSKTIHEQEIAEFTKQTEKHPYSESFLPLLLCERNNRYYLLNSR